jgi:uncharacterized repeat protein (TIGR01451 family)
MVKLRIRWCSVRLHQMLILFLSLVLVFLAAKPVHAAVRETVARIRGEHDFTLGPDVVQDVSYQVLPAWFPPAKSALSLRARPSKQDTLQLQYFYVDAPATGTAGQPFFTTVEARDLLDRLVDVTATVSLQTNGGSIDPTSLDLVSGRGSANVTLERAGVDRLVRVVSGTIQGSDYITIGPGSLYRFEVTTPGSRVAGQPFNVTVTAYDEYNNLETDFQGLVTFTSSDPEAVLPTDATAGWSNGAKSFSLTLRTVGSQTYTVTHESVVQPASITITKGSLNHIRINSQPGNGGQIYGYPVEVGGHTMDIYATYTVWAGSYNAYGIFLGDVSVDWSGTGVLGNGNFSPSPGVSTTFTPAPALDGTGTIEAEYSPSVTDTTGTFTIRAPFLAIAKQGNPDPVPAGGALQYTIVYTNTGDATARDVRITETYDPKVTFVNAGPSPSEGNNVWTRSSLAPDEHWEIYVTVQVEDSLPPGTTLDNRVTISGSRLESHSATETTTVTSAPDLRLSLSDLPDPVTPGGNLVYRAHYINAGNAPVNSAVVTMTYDSQVTFFSSDKAPRLGTNNVWDLGTLEGNSSGDINVTVIVDDYVVDEKALSVGAVITGENSSAYYAFEATTIRAPALTLTKHAVLDPVPANSPLTYTLVYTNAGHAATSALLVTDAVPLHTDYVGCAPGPCSQSGGIVTWERPDLAVGESDSLSLVVNVQRNVVSGTLLSNRARVRIVDVPQFDANAHISTTVASFPSLRVSIDNNQDSVRAGDSLVYILDYANTGNAPAYETEIVVMPPALVLVRDIACEPECQVNGGKLHYDLGTVPAGASGSVELFGTVRLPLPAGIWSITASATILTNTPGDPPEGNTAQDIDPVTTRPDLQLAVDYDGHTPYPGKRITYTVQYSNAAPIGTTGVTLTAKQPDSTTFDAAASSAWVDQGGGHFQYTVGDLDYSEGGTLEFVVVLPSGIFTPTVPSFDATFAIGDDSHSGEDSEPANNTELAKVGVPDLIIEKVEVNWDSLLSGQPGTHVTVTVKNQGSNIACNPVPPEGEGPHWCGRFFLDLYINPKEPPKSFPPDDHYGDGFRDDVGPIMPNQSLVYTITESTDGSPLTLPADIQLPLVLYVRVDNFADRPYGLVAEYNEWNNVAGPILMYEVYLPTFLRRR